MKRITPKRIILKKKCILAFGIALLFAMAGPMLTVNQSWAGGKDKSQKHGQKAKHNKNHHEVYGKEEHHSNINVNVYFGDQQRNAIRNYYTEQYRSGHCPPGLAKKNSRCMAPGQVKKWKMGQPLPRDVIFYDLPPEVVVQLGPPPSGRRFVRVASDILMIAEGTGMVLDAIEDLSRN